MVALSPTSWFKFSRKSAEKKRGKVDVEIIGPSPRTEQWTLEDAENTFPIQARYLVPRRRGSPRVMYCVFEGRTQEGTIAYFPVPIDRKEAFLLPRSENPEDSLEKVSANTTQVFHMEKQTVRRRRYSRKASAMAKIQATMYVCLAGGLIFLLFIIFSEVTSS